MQLILSFDIIASLNYSNNPVIVLYFISHFMTSKSVSCCHFCTESTMSEYNIIISIEPHLIKLNV